MQIKYYSEALSSLINNKTFIKKYQNIIGYIRNSNKVFFIGNGGSNAICSHMAEDYMKNGRFQTFCFSDAPLISCFSNDFGYENAIMEWLKIFLKENDILIAISSSGESLNIINATAYANSIKATTITFTGFKLNNTLSQLGRENIHLNIFNYGIVETTHEIILHSILDEIIKIK